MGVSVKRSWRDGEVAITGRLASMSREEAIAALSRIGSRYVETPGETTKTLVVGSDGPPHGRGGRPTESLRLARQLRARGVRLAIIDEEQFIAEFITTLEPKDESEELQRLYSIGQLSRILDVPVAEIRAWLRLGLLRAAKIVKRLCYFDFSQLSTARRLQRLARRGVTATRIRKSLREFAEWLPEGSPGAAELQVREPGDPMLLRLVDGRLAEPNGQLHLDFPGRATSVNTLSMQPREHSAEDWFNLGIAAEELGNFDSAVEAYQRALAMGDPQPEICFNLGNTFASMDRAVEAAACFIQATEIDPDYVEAWNNLGNALAELGKHDQAIPAYRQALSIQPHYADAHYNLGETLALIDDLKGAQQHWRAYLDHDPNSPWAHRVRQRLSEHS